MLPPLFIYRCSINKPPYYIVQSCLAITPCMPILEDYGIQIPCEKYEKVSLKLTLLSIVMRTGLGHGLI